MFAAVSKLTQAAHKAHRKLDTISHQLIQCVDRDLQEVSDELETSVENLVELQKECQKEDVKNQEEVFLAAINANQELSDILNKSLQRAALSTRGAEYLTDSMERATIILKGATRFVTCNICHSHFLGEVQVHDHHVAYHSHVPFVETTRTVREKDAGETKSRTKVVRDDAASLWKASNTGINSQYSADYKTVLRLKRRSVKTIHPRKSSILDSSASDTTTTSSTKTKTKWNGVDPKRWRSSMLHNASLTLKLLLDQQQDDGHWKNSSDLSELMFCSSDQLRKNALTLFQIPFYPKLKPGQKRQKQASIGDVMINYMCTGAAVFHLNVILQTTETDIRSSTAKAARKGIKNGLLWMQKCVYSQHHGGPDRVFSWISRNQQHWPSIRDNDHDVVVHVHMIQSKGGTTADRDFRTKISSTTPIQSLLMCLNCHFDVRYHYLEAHSCCEIVVRDRSHNYVVFDQLNQTANNTLSSLLNGRNKSNQFESEIDVIFRELENGTCPKYRACLPTQIAIEGIEDRHIVQDVQIAIPQGATLYHLRQIIADEISDEINGRENIFEYQKINEDEDALRILQKKRHRKIQREQERHDAFLEQKSEERMKEIRTQYGTDRSTVVLARSEREFHTKNAYVQFLNQKRAAIKAELKLVAASQGRNITSNDVTEHLNTIWKKMSNTSRSVYFRLATKEWSTSKEFAFAQDTAMKLEIDLKEVDEFLNETPLVGSEWNDEDDEGEGNNGGNGGNGGGGGKILGRDDLATLTLHGPANTHKSFCFVHRGLYVLPEEEATISALESAVQTGSMGISSNMEQHSRLLILLQPATGIDLGIDDE